jgi:hypothetical protein
MNWEQRFREMVLAGGALAAASCGSDGRGGHDGPRDTASGDASSEVGSGPDAEVIDGSSCCNADPDPCCYLRCGGDAAPTPSSACGQELACQADGGTWSLFYSSCSFPREAAPDYTCCGNINPDPCCHPCDEPDGPVQDPATCAQAIACQSDGGTYDPYGSQQADGNLGASCSFAPGDAVDGADGKEEAGPSDAGADSGTHD